MQITAEADEEGRTAVSQLNITNIVRKRYLGDNAKESKA